MRPQLRIGLGLLTLAVGCRPVAPADPSPPTSAPSAPSSTPATAVVTAPVEPEPEAPAPVACTEACAPKRLLDADHPSHLRVDATHLYWLRGSSLYAMPREGGEPKELATDLRWAPPVLDDDAVYVCRNGPQAMYDLVRLPKDGGAEQVLGTARACWIAVLDGKLYFPERDDKWHQWLVAVTIADGPGATATRVLDPGGSIEQLLTDETHLYWQAADTIHRYDPKTNKSEVVADKLGSVRRVGLTDTHVVWLQGSDMARVPKGGGAVEVFANHQDALAVTGDDGAVYWSSVSDDGWRRLAADGTMVTYAVPGGASSIAVDGTRVWWTAFSDDGGIDTLQTCGCGDDVLAPTEPMRQALPPDPSDVARWRTGYLDEGELRVQVRDLSADEASEVEKLERKFGTSPIPAGTQGLPKRFAMGDAYRVATTKGVFDVAISGYEAAGGGEGMYLYLRMADKGVRGSGGLVTTAPAPGLGKLRKAKVERTLAERYLPAVKRELAAAKKRRPIVGKWHLKVWPASLPAPHAVLISVAAPNPDESTEYLSALYLGDAGGEITGTIYEPDVRLDTFTVQYLVDIDSDRIDEVLYTSEYYEGSYEHLLTWRGKTPETTLIAGDGA